MSRVSAKTSLRIGALLACVPLLGEDPEGLATSGHTRYRLQALMRGEALPGD